MHRINMVRGFRSDPHGRTMCFAMRRCRMARYLIRERPSCSSADYVVEEMVTKLKTLGIAQKNESRKTRIHDYGSGLYVWSSPGKCAPYAVPKKVKKPEENTDGLYSLLSGVRFGAHLDVANLRLQLIEDPLKTAIPHRRRYLRFGSYFCAKHDER
ncbi:unnamed protein product [Cylicocyclus nassatus]|uniref:Uncharacterized protein n=1 Tax=Cylicocyclus nassatus TaxID=53992 RepID=A0AA36DTX4_CYLNA|nr:unnamed protein product [Cylicocyclus nassatus]